MRTERSLARRSPAVVAFGIVGVALSACSGGAPEPAQEPPAAAAPAPAPPPPVASAAPTSAPSAVASAAPSAPPSKQGKCGAGMAEVAGAKFKSSYYKKEMTVAPFCIDVNLTTTDEYSACVTAGKCDKNTLTVCDPSTFAVSGRGTMPMVCVDFIQAEKYCTAQSKRLVSDPEWEWVARGGEEARTFPWGNDAPGDQLCWSGKEKRKTPCPVASYPASNPWGIFDLAGNINQWTTTTNDASSSFRVGRGGSWKDGTADLVKVSHSGGFKNTYRCGFLGIRCATAVP